MEVWHGFLVFVIVSVVYAVGGIIQGYLVYKKRDENVRSSIEVCRLRLDEMNVKLGVVLSIVEQIQTSLPKPGKLPRDGILDESAFRQQKAE